MNRLYHAPYILGQFRPHFSLATSVPADRRKEIFETMQTLYDGAAVDTTINVNGLALMTRPDPDGPWLIAKEIPLPIRPTM